jgi:hypothetical protein
MKLDSEAIARGKTQNWNAVRICAGEPTSRGTNRLAPAEVPPPGPSLAMNARRYPPGSASVVYLRGSTAELGNSRGGNRQATVQTAIQPIHQSDPRQVATRHPVWVNHALGNPDRRKEA